MERGLPLRPGFLSKKEQLSPATPATMNQKEICHLKIMETDVLIWGHHAPCSIQEDETKFIHAKKEVTFCERKD